MCVGALSAIGGIASGVLGSNAAKDATATGLAATQAQVDLARETRDMTREDLAPFLDSGVNALAAYNYNLGLGNAPVIGGTTPEVTRETVGLRGRAARRPDYIPPGWQGWGNRTQWRVGDQIFDNEEDANAYAAANPVGGTVYGGFEESPGYQFRLQEGMDAIEASTAARRGLVSGNMLRSMNEYGQDYGSAEFNNYQNQLLGPAGMGQSSAAMSANNNANFANMAGNALGNQGNIGMAGAIGQANAWTGALNNLSGAWGYQNGINIDQPGSLFGGSSWS